MTNDDFDFEEELRNVELRENKKKIIALVAGIIVLLLLAGGGIGIALHQNSKLGNQTTKDEVAAVDEAEAKSRAIAKEQEASYRKEFGDQRPTTVEEDQTWMIDDPNPKKLAPWQSKSRLEQLENTNAGTTGSDDSSSSSSNSSASNGVESASIDELTTERVNWFNEVNGVQGAVSTLPSRESGFTEDPSQMEVDGGLNPLYSYWTSEGFIEATSDFTERLLNPIYGDWVQVQYDNFGIDEFLVNRFVDIFEPNYLSTVSEKPTREWIPVYADWDGDNYGGLNLADAGFRWVGTPENVNVTFNDTQTEAQVEVDVLYTAWGTDKSTIERTGKLKYTVVAGDENQHYMIKNATLEVDTK